MNIAKYKKKQEKTLNTSIQTSRQLKQKIPTYKRQLKPYHLTESNITDWRRFHVIIDYLPLYPIIAYWKSVKQKMYKCIISSPPSAMLEEIDLRKTLPEGNEWTPFGRRWGGGGGKIRTWEIILPGALVTNVISSNQNTINWKISERDKI